MHSNAGSEHVPLRRFGAPDTAPDGTAHPALVCFPAAGGGATAFAHWRRLLPAGLDLYAYVAPGREERGREAPFDAVADLVDDVMPAVSALSGPVILIGHSFGACLAYETAHRLALAGRPPAHLFVLAAGAPGAADLRAPQDDREIELLWKRLGANPAGLSRPGFREWLFPVLRADFSAYADYRPGRTRLTAAVPVTALYGDEDTAVAAEAAARWRSLCAGPFETAPVAGAHFFPQTQAAATVRELTRVLGPEPTGGQPESCTGPIPRGSSCR